MENLKIRSKVLKRIPGFPKYLAGDNGLIYTKKKNQFVPLTIFLYPYSKYFTVFLSDKNERTSMYVHILVAKAFLKSDLNGFDVLHLDNCLFNNSPSNLTLKKTSKSELSQDLKYSDSFIKSLELELFSKLKNNSSHPVWKNYLSVKSKSDNKLTYNFLNIHSKLY
ncbi:MAG: hypothetical protein IAE65_10280 [Ignavibacteria bacterium]|nr:hypothetical protein [Ignavibacteria bacterium]